jgi:PAS domain S-box-containing protein
MFIPSDATQRKRADEELLRQKADFDEPPIAAGAPLSTTLEGLCRLAEDVERGALTMILVLDRTGRQLRKGAAPSLPPSYIDGLDGVAVGLGIGPCPAAAHLGTQVISLDLASDERWSDVIRALASAHGLRTCWSTPIKSPEGRVLGTFAVYPNEPTTRPSPEQQNRIEQLSHLASIAIEHAQNDGKRDVATVLDAIPGMVALLSPTAEVEAVNNELLAYLGQPLEVIKQWGTNGIVHPEDVPRAAGVLMQAMSDGQPYETEVRIRRFDGVYRWNSTRGLPFLDSSGGILRWYAIVSDIDDRKRAENGLRESEQRHERAMLAAEAGFWDWDVPADEFYVSPKLLEMAGFAPETEFAGRADFMARAVFHPDDRVKWERAVKELFASGGTRLAMELRSIHGGETRWSFLSGMCVRDAAGNILRWTGSATDVTARKRAEGLLAGEKHLLDMMARATPLSTVLDALCRIVEENLAGCLCGISLVDASGTRLENGAGPSLPPAYVDAIADKLMERDASPCCMAALQGEQVISADVATETRWVEQGWCALALSYGLRSIWSTPIVSSAKKALGTFALYFTQPASPTAEHLAIIERFTHVAAVAIERSLAEEALRRSEAALRVSDERHAHAMDAAAEGHFDADLETGEMFVSARLNEIYNFPQHIQIVNRTEFINRIPFHPDDRRLLDDMVKPEFIRPEWQGETQDFFEYDCRIIPRPGEVRWIHTRGKLIRDAEGCARRRVGVVADITERKRAEEALRLSEERYALAMEASEEGHFDWNVQTDEVFTSEHLKQVLDLPVDAEHRTRGELMAAHIPFHPADRERIEEMTRELLAGDALNHEFEYRLLRGKARELRWIHTRWKIFRDATGLALRVIGVVSDITERRRAADELRESEARFRALTALWSDWYWRQDEHLRFTYSTAAIDPPDGYPGGSAIGKARWELPDIAPLSSSWDEHRKLLAAHKPFRDFEYSRVAGDGTVRYVSTSGTPIFDEDGEFRGYHGVGRDITERKRVEEELHSRQEMLEVAQKAARAVAFEWRVDAGQGQNRWSPELEAMYGIPAGSYDGTFESWKKLVHTEDWPTVSDAIKTARETGDVDAQYRVVHAGGAISWLHAKGRLFFDAERKPTRIVGFMLDVTDRHLGAEELRRMERQLRQAQRLEALGTLAGGIAHDFNNLLGAILGYGEMALRNVRAGSRLRRDIESMVIAGERGRSLVERILAFSRSGVGERIAVHVEGVVRETLALFTAKLPSHIVIEQRLQAGNAAVMGDPTQIHQVLMNLLTNAVQAMPSGGTLRISLERARVEAARVAVTGTVDPGEYLALVVADTGSGIPADIFERIFDPFFTTKDVGVGTGLGLSLVHGIVTGLGGVIDVATTVGTGSVFKVYLPSVDDVVVPSKPRRPLRPKPQRMCRGHVMVIDDEDALVRLATTTLTELGYSATGFTSGAKAMEAFRADPKQFDAVITDESMPGASGSALIRRMRALRPALPILLMSGYLSAAVTERAREAGATEVLKKPLSARQLQMAVERVLPATSAPSTNDLASSKLSGHSSTPRRKVGPPQSPRGPARE